MTREQWGHGYRRGYESGTYWGELMGQGATEMQYTAPANRLELLARGLFAEANGPDKSSMWWACYASIVAKELHLIATQLPSSLAALRERPDEAAEVEP